MIISFDDRSVHTTEVRIVRAAQGIDLGKLRDTHHIYKEVIHDVVSVNDGIERLDALLKSEDKFHAWIRVLVFGLTSATAAPFSFGARVIDLPLCFLFGCLVGFLQLIVAAQSKLYSNVLEVTATVLVSFLARAFGSIRGGSLFCFSGIAQGGIVMLLVSTINTLLPSPTHDYSNEFRSQDTWFVSIPSSSPSRLSSVCRDSKFVFPFSLIGVLLAHGHQQDSR